MFRIVQADIPFYNIHQKSPEMFVTQTQRVVSDCPKNTSTVFRHDYRRSKNKEVFCQELCGPCEGSEKTNTTVPLN